MNQLRVISLKAAGVVLLALVAFCVAAENVASDAGSGLSDLAAVPAIQSCSSLLNASLSSTVGAKTQILSAKTEDSRHGPVCVVAGSIGPGHIGFEVHLPSNTWTQRYLQTGCGGLCGMVQINVDHAEGCTPVEDGEMATASTDMGHNGKSMGDGSFGDDPQARIDFAYRGVHLTALAAKALIQRFYGQPAKFSYFSGCSDGGREALMEAQRYPDDFDGIAAGAPAMNFQIQNSFYHAWQARSNMDAQGHAILTADKLPILHAAALAECDAKDGLKDGQIDDPRRCQFDPGVTECKVGVTDTSHCLTHAQVETARKLYAGAHDAQGHRFVIGSVQVGSELQWKGVFVPDASTDPIPSADMAMSSVRNLAFEKNPPAGMQVTDFKFDVATFDRLKPLHGLYDATNPDIRQFVGHGGKLILWHGWADPHISPINTIAYYNAVEAQIGSASTQSVRLFLFPGMGHCSGGDGPSQFDVLTPLMRWVESRQVPEKMVAGRPSVMPSGPPGAPPKPSQDGRGDMKGHMPPMAMMGKSGLDPRQALPVNRTRPVFPYPEEARYTGKGSVDDARNFVSASPTTAEPQIPAWEGASFYQPGFQKDCSVIHAALVCK